MGSINNRSYTNLRGLNLTSVNGCLRFETPDSTPSTTSDERLLYVNSSNQLIFDDGSSSTTLGSAGSVANFSLNDAYDDGSTITVDSSAVTLNANLAGAALIISQSGAGGDIQGTSSNWTMSKAGALVCTAIAMADNEAITLGTGSDATIAWNGSLLNIAGATDFDNAVTTQGTLTVGTTQTITGGADSNALTVTAGEIAVSDGSVDITDADNAASFTVTNSAATTIGAAAAGGVAQLDCASLTTGALLSLELTEGTLNGGWYVRAWDVTGSAAVWSVGENGATTIAGNALGTDALTVTAGDITVASGALSIDASTSTAAGIQVNGSGAAAANTGHIEIVNTDAGAVGGVFRIHHNSASPAAADVVSRLLFDGEDAADNVTSYARIDAVIRDTTNASEDGDLMFYVDRAGTLTLQLQLDSDVNGLVVGDGAAAGIVQSSGNYDLTLQTGNATTGSVTLTDGADGNITLTPNGDGAVDLAGKVLCSETTTSSGAGAVAVTGSVHEITTTGADALTLADGTEGQVLFVVMVTDGGDGTLTPTNLAGNSTITFDAVGDAVTLLFTNGSWTVVGNVGCALA